MRSSLPFPALLGVALVLGCQDLGPAGPDGLVPQFAKGGEKGKPDKPGGGGGDVAGFLTLTGGIAKATDLDVVLSGSYAAQNNDFDDSVNPITMNFPYFYDSENPESFLENCEIIRGIDGVHHATEIEAEYAELLLAKLNATVQSGKFYMDINPTGLVFEVEATTGYFIDIQYDHKDGDAFILLGWGDGPTVEWVRHTDTQDEFILRGPIRVGIRGVTGGRGKKSNRTIACGGANNAVTVTVTRPAA